MRLTCHICLQDERERSESPSKRVKVERDNTPEVGDDQNQDIVDNPLPDEPTPGTSSVSQQVYIHYCFVNKYALD